ncbi:MAG: hypothetical protein GXP54_12025 [Deltaproteobacteria bacterium]|nr:hypothetical protein [Deltaproteobacteria bacterium]
MGCCNKTVNGIPIKRSRYWIGTLFIGFVLAGLLTYLTLLAPFVRRYRRMLPFYRAYARDVFSSILRRDRILLEGEEPEFTDCPLEGRQR